MMDNNDSTDHVTPSKPLCRYYMHGACEQGSSCSFAHDFSVAPSMVCRYYQQGMCRYGDRCRYDHVRNRPTNNHLPSAPVRQIKKDSHCDQMPNCDGESVTKSMTDSNRCPVSQGTLNAMSDSNRCPVSQGTLNAMTDSNRCPVSQGTLNACAAEFIPRFWQQTPTFPTADVSLSLPKNPYCSDDAVPTSSSLPPVCTYSSALKNGRDFETVEGASAPYSVTRMRECDLICPYALQGSCLYGSACAYVHGDPCELCGLAALHPTDEEQREAHTEECQRALEKDMELSFQVAQSQQKECGICMDVVIEKEPPHERKFGILSNCNHVFCLACIRKWRKERSFDSKAIRSCPECRTVSDFVTPSDYWVEMREEKEKLIEGYKAALRKKPCQYFKKGQGECPFNEHCFYQHAYPDGRIASPKPRPRRRRRNASGELQNLEELLLWDFLEERENLVLQALEDELAEQLLFAISLRLSSDCSSSDSDLE